MFLWLFNLFVGCGHHQKSFPFTPVRRSGSPNPARSGTYVVCLGCGKTFAYDWNEMRMAPPAPARGRIERNEVQMVRPAPACPRFDWNQIQVRLRDTTTSRIDARPRRIRA